MLDCYGQAPLTGRVIAHSPQGGSLTIRTRLGDYSGGVELMVPTGKNDGEESRERSTKKNTRRP